jgi:hypothetical protein
MARLRERPAEVKINKVAEKNVFPKKHYHPKIINCRVNKEKITVELEDQREISLPLNLIVKEWFCLNKIKEEQLKNYKIWGGGYTIFFPELEEDIPVRIFTEGINSDCCC